MDAQSRIADPPDAKTRSRASPKPSVPTWLTAAVGLAYFTVGAAHLIVGALIGAGEKPLVLAAVLALAIVNIATLESWRERLIGWWLGRAGQARPVATASR